MNLIEEEITDKDEQIQKLKRFLDELDDENVAVRNDIYKIRQDAVEKSSKDLSNSCFDDENAMN